MSDDLLKINNKPKLLFHICCAPCSGWISQQLRERFDLTVYFDNSNIWPEEEFQKRAQEASNYFSQLGVDFVLVEPDHDAWKKSVEIWSQEPERGKRCKLCYYQRLKQSAQYAKDKGFDYLATSLTISPHKDARCLTALGLALAKKYDLNFLTDNFRLNDGYKKSQELAKELDFYQQNYCGCEFGLKNGKIIV